MTQISKTIYFSYHLAFSIAYSYQIVSTVFISCQSTGFGGAIFTDNKLLNCTVFLCSFDHCSTTGSNGHGGAITFQQSQKVIISSSCFKDCIAYRCPGVFIYGLASGSSQYCLEAHANMTSEYNPSSTSACSAYYSNSLLFYYNNNVTRSISYELSSGVLFGASTCNLCGRFITFIHCQGAALIGHRQAISGITNTIEYANFISGYVMSTGGLVEMGAFECTVKLYSAIFYNCTFPKAVKQLSSVGTVEFFNCVFDQSQAGSQFSFASTINCIFSNNPTFIMHAILSTKICWEDNQYIKDPYTQIIPFNMFYRYVFFQLFF